MKIHGLQKLTLLDFPGKTACTIFTPGCNFRCPFCHNSLLVTEIDDSMAYSEKAVLEYLAKRTKLLDGVCITGGEPLLQQDIQAFTEKIKNMGYSVKLDTNGTFPDKLASLIDKGLVDYVAMDIKNSEAKYRETAGVENLDISVIKKSIDIIMNSGIDYEFRTTVVDELHTVSDIAEAAELIRGAKRYYLQNFVDSGNLIGRELHAASKEKLQEMKKAAEKLAKTVEIRGI